MSSAAQSLSILMLLAGVAVAGIGTFALRHYREPGARGFALMGLSMACWTAVVAVNIHPAQLLPLHVSMTLRNGCILGLSLGWLLFAVEYRRRDRLDLRARPLVVALVLGIPVLTVLLTATNPVHHLAIGPGTPADVGGGPNIEWGPWHLIFMAYGFTITVLPAGLLARELRSAHGVHRRQVLLILTAWGIGFLGANDYLLTGAIEGVPGYVRITPFAFLLAAILFALALFRHQLFGLVPVSRRTVVETMPDPVIAVDGDGTVVDMNPAAYELFDPPAETTRDRDEPADTGRTAEPTDSPLLGEIVVGDGGTDSLGDVAGTPLATLCADRPRIVEHYRTGTDTELSINRGDTTRHFSVTSEPIQDDTDGSVILLRDVTALKRRERQLEEKNRQLDRFASFVSHDLRNPLNTAQLSLELADADGEYVQKVETAHDRMEQMIGDIRELTNIDRESATFEPVDLERVAPEAWAQVQTGDATLTIAEGGTLTADRMYLLHVFENLFRNAVEHGSTSPDSQTRRDAVEHGGAEVSVTVGLVGDGFYVADDGPGIPEAERDDVLEYGYSTASEGSGLGLAIVESVADVHGWDVTITESADGGARFEFR
jgi:signal transduction histidine kinase